jgi:hypothetical protein
MELHPMVFGKNDRRRDIWPIEVVVSQTRHPALGRIFHKETSVHLFSFDGPHSRGKKYIHAYNISSKRLRVKRKSKNSKEKRMNPEKHATIGEWHHEYSTRERHPVVVDF